MSADITTVSTRSLRVALPSEGYTGAGLLRDLTAGRENLDAHRKEYRPAEAPSLEQLLALLNETDLRGRGGAGFPAGRKLASVAEHSAGTQPIVIANGEEGEPASAKDRYLLIYRPHIVLDGLELVRGALHASRAVVYLSDPAAARSVEKALAERGESAVEIYIAPRRYVSGEETAAVRAINGGPALPTQKPPRPFERGVDDRPTAVLNVETLARIAQLRSAARGDGPGGDAAERFLMTLWGPEEVVLTEARRGMTLRELADTTLGIPLGIDPPVLAGGFFAGFLPSGGLDLPVGVEEFRSAGTSLGCGAFIILPDGCPLDIATDVMAFFDRENAHQCGSCFKGTAAMHQALRRLGLGEPEEKDLANLHRWSQMLPGRGSCATLDGAADLVATLLHRYPGVVEQHRENSCAACRAGAAALDTRFRVNVPEPINEE